MGRKESARATVRVGAPRVLSVLIWTLVTWGIWLISLSAISPEELLVSGLCALLCGVVAERVREAVEGRWHPSPDLLRAALTFPVAIVTDAASVLTMPFRRPRPPPSIRRVPIGASGADDQARTRRAIATAVTSLSPGTVVLNADPEDGSLLIHALGDAGPSLAERFAAPAVDS